ncbi:MAG: hypothetical protein Q8Q60_04860 [Candidatus Chromulinivorax sp.]|nr:hypothetical protein [Candidatus Chromulinivorax sp.]
MMNSFKKIFTVAMLASNLIAVARDDNSQFQAELRKRERQYELEREQAQKSTPIWAGVIGGVVGGLLGYWVGSSEAGSDVEYRIVENIDYSYELLSPREREIKSRLDMLAKYGQNFNTHDYSATIFSPISEQEIIVNVQKLGFRLDQIDAQFYTKLAQENKILSDIGYSIWWYSLKNLECQKDLYLSNSNKIIAYFNRHQDFIRGCQLINLYHDVSSKIYNSPTIMIYPPVLPAWIYTQVDPCNQYPFMAFKNKVEADRTMLLRLQQRYTGRYVVERVSATLCIVDHVLNILYNSYPYQQEVAQKQQEELLAEYKRIEQERLAIARKQAQALEEANRLAAERNRIERERRDW